MKVILQFEPDVENYKLENIDHLAIGEIREKAFEATWIKIEDLKKGGIGLGELYGEVHDIKEIKREMLELMVEAIVKAGFDPFTSEYYMNRSFIGDDEVLVAWVIAKED